MRALAVGEDLRSDPVSMALGMGLAAFSRGHLAINAQLLSQVPLAWGQGLGTWGPAAKILAGRTDRTTMTLS